MRTDDGEGGDMRRAWADMGALNRLQTKFDLFGLAAFPRRVNFAQFVLPLCHHQHSARSDCTRS